MKTATTTTGPEAPLKAPEPFTRASRILSNLRSLIARKLLWLAVFLEARPWIPLTALALLYTLAVLYESESKPLWHDEIFTYHIAQAPTLADSFRQLRAIDLNPPLLYLIIRISFYMFGVSTFTCRLPGMLAFLLAMLFLFLFIRRRAGVLYGCLAASLLFAGPAGILAVEARPYSLMLCFVCLALVAWQKAAERARSAIPLLLLASFGMLLTHIFSVLPWAIFAFVEFLRLVKRRGSSPRYLLAWSLCPLAALIYLPMIRNHSSAIFPTAFQPNIYTIYAYYGDLVGVVAAAFLLTFFTLLLVAGRDLAPRSHALLFTPAEWLTLAGLALVPIPLMLELIHSHAAFFPRYGIVATVGVAAAGTGLLAISTTRRHQTAMLALIFTLLISSHTRAAGHELLHRRLISSQEPKISPCEPCAAADKIDPSLPLAIASGITFVEMNQHESPAAISRLVFLTDPKASAEYAHADIFNAEAAILATFGMKGRVEPYSSFIAQHPRFFVYGTYDYPEDWLLRKLHADGATLILIDHPGGPYINRELYEVEFK